MDPIPTETPKENANDSPEKSNSPAEVEVKEESTTTADTKPEEPSVSEKPSSPVIEDEMNKKDYADHLLVLQHGLHGSDKDFDFVKLQMETRYKGLIVVCSTHFIFSEKKTHFYLLAQC